MTADVLQFTPADFQAAAPELALTLAGCLLVLLEAFAPRVRYWFATLSLAAVAGSLWLLLRAPAGASFGGRYETSALTAVLVVVYVAGTGLAANADWYGVVIRWLHFLAGITWIGLLYFFNVVNAGFMKSLDGPTKNIVIPKLMPPVRNSPFKSFHAACPSVSEKLTTA